MKRIAITELKNRLSEYLRLVKRGETIEILEHSVPIARIEAMRPANGKSADVTERLVRAGMARAPTIRMEKSFWSFTPVPCTGDAVAAVIDERGDR